MDGCIMQPEWKKAQGDRLIRSDRTEMQRKPNWKERYRPMKSIDKAVEVSAETMKNVVKRNSIRFGAALLVALASLMASPNAALAAAAQHHDQVPGFYRLKVGNLEVTALFDGTAVFDRHWLNGTNATMDGVVKALHEDPHMLDVVNTGFLVNTGKQLILVDAGAGTWWGGGALGRLASSLRSAGYTPEEVDLVLVTHLHSDHVGGLTTQDGKRVFPNADVYVAKAESDFWLSPEIAAQAPKDAQPFFQSAQAIAASFRSDMKDRNGRVQCLRYCLDNAV
jgi:metallo-beta-lactamase superfamily protein